VPELLSGFQRLQQDAELQGLKAKLDARGAELVLVAMNDRVRVNLTKLLRTTVV